MRLDLNRLFPGQASSFEVCKVGDSTVSRRSFVSASGSEQDSSGSSKMQSGSLAVICSRGGENARLNLEAAIEGEERDETVDGERERYEGGGEKG